MPSGYLYILRCADNSYYIGSSTNLETRLAAHRDAAGGSDYTIRRLPITLVFSEEFPTLHDAFLAERQVKGWSRAKKEALIRRDYAALPELSWSTTRKQEHVLRQAQDAIRGVEQTNQPSEKDVALRHAEPVEARYGPSAKSPGELGAHLEAAIDG